MGSRPFPEISCMICRDPVTLIFDLCTDENGKAVHEDCYANRLISARLVKRYNRRVHHILAFQVPHSLRHSPCSTWKEE
jgi:hypothetical protein